MKQTGFIYLSITFIIPFLIKDSRKSIIDYPVSSSCFSCDKKEEGWIFCDDFETNEPLNKRYFEYSDDEGDFIRLEGIGTNGSAGMRVIFQPGEVDAGSIKKSFGFTPGAYISKNSSSPNKKFNEIYWRVDVKHQIDWIGGWPAKLSRATSLANENWAQGMIAHIWASGRNSNYLLLDPATGIDVDGNLLSTVYNDFDNLRWLGNKEGITDIFDSNDAGKWNCIVGHVKLNTPGKSDGIFEFWINNILQARSEKLNWHADWNQNSNNSLINAVFFENYWNQGSPKLQERYMDNILISTDRIYCDCNAN